MVGLVYSPRWFFGKDILIDAISLVVLLIIAAYSFYYYHMDKKKKSYLSLAISFALIGISFIAKILTNFTLYHNVQLTKQVGLLTLTLNTVQPSNILFILGFLFYRLFMLLGLFFLFSIYTKPKVVHQLIIFYFILALIYFSRSSYYVFHLTTLIFLIGITFRYLQNYKKNRLRTTKLLALSFGLITLSQAIFIFIEFNLILYVVAEIIQLIGYFALLVTFVKVLKDGKKARKK